MAKASDIPKSMIETYGFTPLAPEIARSTDFVQSAVCRREIRCGWQGSLAGSLTCAINIEHQVVCSLSIPQPTRFFCLLQRSSEQVFEKHHAQCLNRRLIQHGEKATECRAMGEVFSPEESHERGGEGL